MTKSWMSLGSDKPCCFITFRSPKVLCRIWKRLRLGASGVM